MITTFVLKTFVIYPLDVLSLATNICVPFSCDNRGYVNPGIIAVMTNDC